jgi:HEAT repeat protein
MDIGEILNNKNVSSKVRLEILSHSVLEGKIAVPQLIKFAKQSKDSVKASCIESLEFATKEKPEIADRNCFDFVTECLTEKAPRVKWESARVIGNIIHLFQNDMDKAICNLLKNSEYSGTVVRWSAAYAIGQILKLETKKNVDLIPAAEAIIIREEKNSIKKIYLEALKKIKSY